MSSFYELILSIVGHVSGARTSRLTHAASFAASPQQAAETPPERPGATPLPG